MGITKTVLLGVLFGLALKSGLSSAVDSKFAIFKAMPAKALEKARPSLQFTAPGFPSTFVWYALWPTDLRISLRGRDTFKINFYCFVNSLTKREDQLTKAKFCFKHNDDKDRKCDVITAADSRTIALTKYLNAKLDFDPANGGSASVEASASKNMNLKFYCSVGNRMGDVTSNMVEIQDFRGRFPSSVWHPELPAGPIFKKQPHTFRCMESAVAPTEGQPPFNIDWSICREPGAVDPSDCKMRYFSELPPKDFHYYTKGNGDLYVPFFPSSVVGLIQNHKLVCSVNQRQVTYYSKVLTFKDGGTPLKKLSMINPKGVQLRKVLNSPGVRYFFPCDFEAGEGDVSVTWQHKTADGTVTNIAAGDGMVNSVKVKAPRHAIRLYGPFTDKTAGEFTCTVKWTPASGTGQQTVTGSYKIEVEYFPSISPKMVPLKYVVDGDDGEVQCLFEGMKITPALAINGIKINLASKTTVLESVNEINAKYSTVMATMTLEVTPYNPKPGAVITSKSLKMAYKDALKNRPSSHTVQCEGKNAVGSVRMNTLLRVVPKPKVDPNFSPKNLNCTECSAAEDHTVHCKVTNTEEIKASGVIFNQFWQLGATRVIDLLANKDAPAHKYLTLSDDKTSLTIKKIDDADFKKQVNRLGTVECVLTLGYPTGMKLPAEVKTTGVEKGLFFLSSHRKEMKDILTTPIKLTNIAPPVTKTGGIMWLLPVILTILVLIIIIVLTYYCCRHRQKGEEYNVDAKEKQQGNDPETEVAEKEAFPVYERPEDGPIRGSRASLDDSIHVGSDDEDEVLAEYDVDIGKFDEEGSFIGQYAVNDGNQTGNRRLPQVGNNTEV